MKPSFWRTIIRSGRLRCPACGQGKVSKSWRELHKSCSHCGLDFQVESGFYLGSIYVNYGVCVLLLAAVLTPLLVLGYITERTAYAAGLIVAIVFPMAFLRFARSFWLGFGYYIDHNVRNKRRERGDEPSTDQTRSLVNEGDEAPQECSCPFCHRRVSFSATHAQSWQDCPYCGQKVLLTASSG